MYENTKIKCENLQLLACPFCGSDAEYIGECDMVWVRCSNIDCGVVQGTRYDEANEAATDWNTRHRSWDLLMEWVDNIYPERIFNGESGCVGDRIIAKLREIDALRKLEVSSDCDEM